MRKKVKEEEEEEGCEEAVKVGDCYILVFLFLFDHHLDPGVCVCACVCVCVCVCDVENAAKSSIACTQTW